MHNRQRQADKLNKCKPDTVESRQLFQAQSRNRCVRIIVAFVLVQACILSVTSYAWYTFLGDRNVYSEEREVMPPYYLYLVNDKDTERLQLTVGNLHPGETKEIVIGVTNKDPNAGTGTGYTIGKDSSFHYELELVHTENLPLKYRIYALQSAEGGTASDQTVTVNGKPYTKHDLSMAANSGDISNKNNEEMYGTDWGNKVNRGNYKIYDKTSGADFTLETIVDTSGNVQFDLDYYMIELEWEDGIQFSDYLKETDLIYVLVNAMQLEPEETAGTP